MTFNDRWAEIIGYSIEELEPLNVETWRQNTHPDDLQKATLALEQHFRKETETYECELRMRHKLGGWVWVLASGKVVEWDTDGKPLRMAGTHLDISGRKQSVEMLINLNQNLEERVQKRTSELQLSESRLREAQQIAHLGSWELDVSTRQNSWSIEVFRIFRLDPNVPVPNCEEMLAYFPTDDRIRVLQLIDRAIQLGESFEIDLQIIRADGSWGYVFVKAEAVWNAEDVVTRLFGIVMDISDRKQSETKLQLDNQELMRATRLKDEFLANMSHELRTPLNSILGMNEALQDKIFGSINEGQLKALQTIENSSRHLLTLINDILDVAKIESGQVTLELKATDIDSLCKSSIAFIKQQALTKRIQLIDRIPKNLPEIMLDETRIRQVLINLLNNAVKFTLEGGTITLEVSQVQLESSPTNLTPLNYIKIAVIDTGIGISAENIQKLFQPFIQIDSALNRQYTGTGLGLALVKRLVEIHGGNVELTSEVGVGSCFAINLPFNIGSPAIDAQTENLSGQSQIGQSQTEELISPLILLAEDNEANIATFSSYLKAKGYRILSATDGQQAIDLAKAEHPDLILMDIQMPVIDGMEAIKQIRLDSNLADIPIIALTALAMTGDRDRCLAVGANEYLSKPIKLKSLDQMIQTWLKEASH